MSYNKSKFKFSCLSGFDLTVVLVYSGYPVLEFDEIVSWKTRRIIFGLKETNRCVDQIIEKLINEMMKPCL